MIDTIPKRSRYVGDELSRLDRILFLARRIYNRTVGTYIFGWTHDRLMIFGYSIMPKLAVTTLYSKQGLANLRTGLQVGQYREVDQALEIVSVLPKPELPDGLFSERQMAEHGIWLFWNRYYVFSI